MASPASLLFSLIQEFSKWGPQASSSIRSSELVSISYSWTSLRHTESECLGVGPSNLEFYKHPMWFWGKLVFQNIYSPSSDHNSGPLTRTFFFLMHSLLFKNLFYLSIVDLQWCVNFCCTEKLFNYIYIHIYTFLFILSPIMVYHRILNIVSCAIQ